MPNTSTKSAIDLPATPNALKNSLLNAFGTSAWLAPSEYMVDVTQRTILFWDLLRQRSEQYYAQKEKAVPHVLSFDAELVLDARTFDRPTNYLLVRVTPPEGVEINEDFRPFVVVDPRAGHGPGIGGFKADSELGVAMAAGHPCYFIGFTPDPMPGQTIEDITLAQAVFLEKIIELHPNSDGKPCIIGNCQAGWAVMLLAATRPELCGPVIVPGSPLSYWAGVEGENPMRYTGGLSGGSWITELTSDLGNGIFDGGHLVKNFENLNPANTLWGKNYDIWSTVDKGAGRFLEFEKWWGGHVNLNGEEIQCIVDQLFVGNHLSTGKIKTSSGAAINLRNIRSPIICFCSKGDNITPPQQALGWINDLYATDDEILSCGQTIIYAIHESVGHLGIFVSGGIAKKEHNEFASNIDLIDVLPPGLYEAVMTPKTDDVANPDLVTGDWIVRFEPRTIADIQVIVQPSEKNERRFAAVRKVSEINLNLYRQWLRPLVRASVNDKTTLLMKKLNTSELQFQLFSKNNPCMPQLAQLAEQVRAQRKIVSADNPLLKLQGIVSDGIVAALDQYRDRRDHSMEKLFISIYDSPALQSMLGLSESAEPVRAAPQISAEQTAFVQQRVAELKAKIAEGGPRAATIRALLYIGMGGAGADERTFNEMRLLRAEHNGMPLPEFKQLVREQFFTLRLDLEGALAALPNMLPSEADLRSKMEDVLQRIVHAAGESGEVQIARLAEIKALFVPPRTPRKRATTPAA